MLVSENGMGFVNDWDNQKLNEWGLDVWMPERQKI